jgi:hypothetical protein
MIDFYSSTTWSTRYFAQLCMLPKDLSRCESLFAWTAENGSHNKYISQFQSDATCTCIWKNVIAHASL